MEVVDKVPAIDLHRVDRVVRQGQRVQTGQVEEPLLGNVCQPVVVQLPGGDKKWLVVENLSSSFHHSQFLDVVHSVEGSGLQQSNPVVAQLKHSQLGQMFERQSVDDLDAVATQLPVEDKQ